MTSWNPYYCGPFNRHGHGNHVIATDADGNKACVRSGCGHLENVSCTCNLDRMYTKYIGCPTHTANPRLMVVPVGGRGWRDEMPWYPEDAGGDLTRDEADRRASELIRIERTGA